MRAAKAKPAAGKKVFSPVRDPLGNSGSPSSAGDVSVQMETLGSLRKKDPRKENPERPSSSASNGLYGKPRRPSSQLSNSRVAASGTAGSLGLEVPRVRERSSSSRLSGATARTVSTSSRLSSHSRPASRATVTATPSSPEPELELPSMQPLSAFSHHRRAGSRTPSPELESPEKRDPATPVPAARRTGLGVLGMGTPEVERWIEAGKGKDKAREEGGGRRVGFKEAEAGSEKESSSEAEEEEEEAHLTMQLSPRRTPPSWAQMQAQAPMPSPFRGISSPAAGAGPGSAAHNLLRTIMADVMYDYQRDTKAEMMGIHLDLVRMGRAIKKELREGLGESGGAAGELERLREENRMLREENERLRRGY